MEQFMIIYIYYNKKRKNKMIKVGLFKIWEKTIRNVKKLQKKVKKYMKILYKKDYGIYFNY